MTDQKQTEIMDVDEVIFPIKRVDGETLEENMNSNGYNNVLPARYLRKNKTGDVIESQEEMFERVAKNIALADVVYKIQEYTLDVVATPQDIKPKAHENRRRDICVDIFGEDCTLDSDMEVELTEDNIYGFSYDTIVPKLPSSVRDEIEAVKDKFYEGMFSLSFMPNSPTLMNAGDDHQQLSACFVNSPEDNIGNIHITEKEAAEVFQSGGGMGYAFSRLRPYGDRVGSSGGIASGPISFMRTFDQMCETIAQGGRRRGAQMGIMNVEHPDIIFFLHAKNKDVSLAQSLRLNDPDDFTHNSFGEALEEARELIEVDENGVERVPKHLRNAAEGHLSNFNISVGITDAFMEAVKNDEKYSLINPRTDEPHIATPETKELYSWFDLGEYVEVGEPLEIPAREVWDRVTTGAWENGEPGMIFLDRINDYHTFDVEENPEYEVLATNPCGEQPLMEYEACNLGHINLSSVVSMDTPDWRLFKQSHDGDLEEAISDFLDEAIDWEILNHRIELGTHFLENVVTMSDFPVEQISRTVADNRKIGLGIMGLAQMYVQMGAKYGSEASNEIARQIMRHINFESKRVSQNIALGEGNYSTRSVFANWEDSKYADPVKYRDWFEMHTGENADDWEDGYPIRNHNTTTIAPTGTTSMIGDTTGGCEPFYNIAYYKNVTQDVQGDEMLVEVDDYFLRVLEANDIPHEPVLEEIQEQMANNNFEGVDSLETVPNAIGELFVTTSDLTAKEHALVQTACQKGVDSAISKTVNAPTHSTVEDASETFMLVYENGGKGVTYYRDGTRTKQVLTTRKDNQGDEIDTDNLVNQARELLDEGEIEPEDLGIDTMTSSADDIPLGTLKPRSRPKNLVGNSEEIKTGYGDLFVTINEYEKGVPFELFANIGKSGGYTDSFTEGLGRLISLCLRSGVDPEEVIRQIESIRSPKVAWDEGDQVKSVPDGVALALRRYLDGVENDIVNDLDESSVELTPEYDDDDGESTGVDEILANGELPECPSCTSMSLYFSEGCKTCEDCGWSEC